MLATLGLEKYEKNFRKGLLTDDTLLLLNDSALQEVRIPPGPRLKILNYVDAAELQREWRASNKSNCRSPFRRKTIRARERCSVIVCSVGDEAI